MQTLRVIATLLLVSTGSLPQTNSQVFTGEIMDSPCAAMGNHDRMMKGVEAKDARECSRKCVQLMGKYVLYDTIKHTTYQLDDQQKSAAYAGQKVSVKGTYDAASKTIHMESVTSQ
jgi:hypothetical protein